MAKKKARKIPSFGIAAYLNTAGVRRKVVRYAEGQLIFSQGDAGTSVFYVQKGAVKISVSSPVGKEAVIALLGSGDFFGEGCIAGQPLRVSTATAIEPTSVLAIQRQEMIRVIREEHQFSDLFLTHMLRRNIRVEEDLVDQLFNSSEKRLARALLLIARYGKESTPEKVVPRISQETLAEIVGTTRGRISFFMNKFRRLGFIKYNGGLHINGSLLRVLIYD
jgi:CRP/FNR family transcriptional regulator, cyclic AMP receptor protein